ncbi:MAG: hypothetical protein M3O03_01185 [Pseudomonadota bacterium]|nr:hypothetical protein [Pseudomonadota bacterium]
MNDDPSKDRVYDRLRIRIIFAFKKIYADFSKLFVEGYHNVVTTLLSRGPQNRFFPSDIENAVKLFVVIVPEVNVVGGGILSLFSISKQLRLTKPTHLREVVVMTRPQLSFISKTYFRNTNFRNDENVFRFSQIGRCKYLSELDIFIPEYACSQFVKSINPAELRFLERIRNLKIVILNQNIELMPSTKEIASLRLLTNDIRMSVGHHAYCKQSVANKYGLPTLLVPAFIDISFRPPTQFEEKKKLIIYSPDENAAKQRCLAEISKALPEFELREIRNVSFETYVELATQCMFSVTFGEGFDGYFIQPMQQGGVGFAVYNATFFPEWVKAGGVNLFESYEAMIAKIGSAMTTLAANPIRYKIENKKWLKIIDPLYGRDDFRLRIVKLAKAEHDFIPQP